MNGKPLYVLATVQAKAGMEAATEKMLIGLLSPTHAEAGCVTYALHKRIDRPGTFYFVEQWESQQALDAHLGSAHISAALNRQAELLSVLDIAVIDPIRAGQPAKNFIYQ